MTNLLPLEKQPRFERTYTALNYREQRKGDRVGLFDVRGPHGLIIVGATLHERAGKFWTGWPGQEYIRADGSRGYANLITFPSKEERQALADDLCGQAVALRDRGRP
jgi:hypothetical protein